MLSEMKTRMSVPEKDRHMCFYFNELKSFFYKLACFVINQLKNIAPFDHINIGYIAL